MKRIMMIATLFVLTISGPAIAGTYTIDPVHSDISFKVRHLVSKTAGQFTDFEGTIVVDFADLDASKVEFSINAASIDTRHEDRDKHLKSEDFFDVVTYPTISFTSSKITRSGKDRFAVTGTLTMHGVSRMVTLPVIFLGEGPDPWGGTVAGFELETTLDRKDYGIVWNRALDAGGMILGDEVAVSITIEAKKQ